MNGNLIFELFVKIIYGNIKVTCKANPCNVRNLQYARFFVCIVETYCHFCNGEKQEYYP